MWVGALQLPSIGRAVNPASAKNALWALSQDCSLREGLPSSRLVALKSPYQEGGVVRLVVSNYSTQFLVDILPELGVSGGVARGYIYID